MTRKLTDADRAAVDLMFDRINPAAGDTSGKDGIIAMANAVTDANINAVDKILKVLSAMPAAEPPADLATRTLQSLARATGMPMPSAVGEQPNA